MRNLLGLLAARLCPSNSVKAFPSKVVTALTRCEESLALDLQPFNLAAISFAPNSVWPFQSLFGQAQYTTVTTWLENLALARSSGTYLRYRDKLAKPDLIIFDDMGMRKLSSTEAQDLCEILEERSIGKSVAFTTQLPLDHWPEVIADPIIADAIRDRLAHAALTINVTGKSLSV